MLFIVGLSHVIKSAACVQVSFQQIELRLCSKCLPLALTQTHTQSLAKVICFSQSTVATFYRWGGYIYESSRFCTPKIIKSVHFSLNYF